MQFNSVRSGTVSNKTSFSSRRDTNTLNFKLFNSPALLQIQNILSRKMFGYHENFSFVPFAVS